MPVVRRSIEVSGLVQGVGFRPFVYRLATGAGLSGWVRNDGEGVRIELQGESGAIDLLQRRLATQAPPLARVERILALDQPPTEQALHGFRIEPSVRGPVRTGVAPDAGICDSCLAELFDPADRRWRHPFTNCTHCGPRYTITSRLPYDRPNTSMGAFAMCPQCLREYSSPSDRRFHAQPNACPRCGPRLWLTDSHGRDIGATDPIAAAVARLAAGEIVAIKAMGGFQLACDARNANSVARLRQLKNREEKPFAIMAAGTASLASIAVVDDAARELLESRERPVVLIARTASCERMLPGVCDAMPWLGAMLPSTPLHYLLFHEAAGRPAGVRWIEQVQPLLLVMTSANPGGEPLVIANDDAVARLGPMCDALLVHDREIVVRCDDSVVRAHPAPQFVRRARGYTPRPIRLPRAGPPVLAVGGHLKNTVCVTRGDEAFLSQHIGDLDNARTCEAMEQAVSHLLHVLDVRPALVAHDLHPDYLSTRFAARFASDSGIEPVAIQHHHAHVAAVMAEHGLAGPVLGLAIDGVGLGEDGGAWGGELIEAGPAGARRVSRLRELPLPGGDRAAREPWRMAAAALHLLGRGDEIETRFPFAAAATVRRMLETGRNSPPTSSLGRCFDAAAALLAISPFATFEGQAPMLLEGLASNHGPVAPSENAFALGDDGRLDLVPLLGAIADAGDAGQAAALFHATLALALARWTARAARAAGLRDIVVGGGCALNGVLCAALRSHLEADGFEVFEARSAPPNDGGLSLGQAWAALQGANARTTEG